MKLIVLGTIVVFGLAIVCGIEDRSRGSFRYWGPQNHSQIAIYYKDNYRQPKCYGALVNWTVVLVPCSCVIAKPSTPDWATWWDHRPRKIVSKDQPSNYKALVMTYEYHSDSEKRLRMVPVTRIDVSPKCDVLFQYNFAKIILQKPIEGTKLAWVAHTSEKVMKKQISTTLEASRIRGTCLVNFWTQYGKDIQNRTQRPIMKYELLFKSEWVACRSMICPGISPPNHAKRHQEPNVCDNKVTDSRFCVNWRSDDPLCRLIPGTPVFCLVHRRFSGLVGFIHNTSMLCDPFRGRNGVLEGVNLALHLIKDDVSIKEITG